MRRHRVCGARTPAQGAKLDLRPGLGVKGGPTAPREWSPHQTKRPLLMHVHNNYCGKTGAAGEAIG